MRSPAFLVGAVILLWWIVCALFGKTIAPYNPVAGSLTAFNDPPSAAHWFGTDSLGRDVFSRVIVGARDILLVASLATLLGTVLGTSIGLVQGYFLGPVDSFVGRLVEAVLALPVVIVAFLFVVALGPSAPDPDRRHRAGVRAAHRPDGADRRAPGAGARLHRRRPAPRRERRCTSCSSRYCRT